MGLVRGAFGRDAVLRSLPRLNVSSCSAVISLHGTVRREDERLRVERVSRGVPGVRDVKNHLRLSDRAG
ncbi:BON domain-containing protein [Rubrobacter radiotolerans]|uniref:BON domain-containing protein n=1 Tax=Rubrobacter radiotolerans TaxID=42256 RepID=UPI0039F023BC